MSETTCSTPGGHRYAANGRCEWCDAERGDDPKTTAIQDARKQALLDAADLLHGWIRAFGDYVPLPDLIPANVWATDAMNDCIDQIEKMATKAQNVPT